MIRPVPAVVGLYQPPRGDLARLGKAIAQHQGTLRDAEIERFEAFTMLFEEPLARPLYSVERRRWLAAALLLCSMVAGLLLQVRPWRAEPPLAFTVGNGVAGVVGAQLVAKEKAHVLHFNDGTTVTLHPGTRAQVKRLVDRDAEIILEDGKLSVAVTPNDNTRWLFRAVGYRVVATGAEFDMLWSSRGGEFFVTMRAGSVLVTEPDGTHYRITSIAQ